MYNFQRTTSARAALKRVSDIFRVSLPSPRLHRSPASPNLRRDYLHKGEQLQAKDTYNLAVYADDGDFIGLENEIFEPAEIAVRNAQRRSMLLEHQANHRPLFDCFEEQATAGASYPNSPATTVSSASPAPRSSRPILKPINIALANTLGNLTGTSPTDIYITDTCDSEYVLHGYGQQHLQASWRDVQIMSRAGNAARERRRKC